MTHRVFALLSMFALLVGVAPGPADATAWDVWKYMPNPDMRSAGYQMRTFLVAPSAVYGTTSVGRAYIMSDWSNTTGTGTFYTSVDENVNEHLVSGKCAHGDVTGTHNNYATHNGHGFDWYGWTSNGLVYLGFVFWYSDCSYDVTNNPNAYNGSVFVPGTFDTSGSAVTSTYTLSLDTTHYDSSGNATSYPYTCASPSTLSGDGKTCIGASFTTYATLDVDPDSSMVRMREHTCSNPDSTASGCTVYHTNWLSKSTNCVAVSGWSGVDCFDPDLATSIANHQKGVWKAEDHTDVNTTGQALVPYDVVAACQNSACASGPYCNSGTPCNVPVGWFYDGIRY